MGKEEWGGKLESGKGKEKSCVMAVRGMDSLGRKKAKFRLLAPPVKNRGRLMKISVGIIRP